jgi:hypothetical protein
LLLLLLLLLMLLLLSIPVVPKRAQTDSVFTENFLLPLVENTQPL